jgi:arylsulfatase A-like enzyme
MVRLSLFLTMVVLSGPVQAAQNEPKSGRPNIVMIVPDQMRGMDMGCMGNREVLTPHLDRLASEGVLFRNTFANTPVCCPARAILLTGKYPHRNGMIANDLQLRESERTLAEILAESGYRTGFLGKWHLDGGPRQPGFVPPGPRRQGFEFWAAHECSHEHFRPTYFRDTPKPIREQRFEAEVWADLAIEFLQAKYDKPFFLEIAMGPPHDPYGAPEKYARLYDANKLTVRPNWIEGTPGGGRKEIAAYYAAITAVDDQVGRIMAELKRLNLERNTIVIVTSDHGDMLGSQGKRLKRKPWEESIRVPGIVRYPSAAKPKSTEAIFSHVDFAPTLLSLCGLPVPADMQGSNLADVITGKTDQGPDSAFFQIFVPFAGDGTPLPWRGVRTSSHLFARTDKGPWVMYDLKSDPFELKNLAHDPAQIETRNRLETRLEQWMKQTGDDWKLNSMEPVEDAGRLYRSGRFTSIPEYLDWVKSHPEPAPRK